MFNKKDLPTLSYRRIRGDMIKMFKITTGVYDHSAVDFVKDWAKSAGCLSIRTNILKIFPTRFKSAIRENSFSIRSAKTWNSVPHSIVSAKTLNTFKNRLDKYWENQEVLYDDYKAYINMLTESTTHRANDRESSGEDQ